MSDKKEKDSKVKSSKAKKNVEKTQEVSVSAEKKIFPHSCTDCGVLNCSKPVSYTHLTLPTTRLV